MASSMDKEHQKQNPAPESGKAQQPAQAKKAARRSARRAKGEGSVFRRRDGRWVAQVTLEDGSQKAFYARTQKEAQAKLRAALREMEEGTLPIEQDQKLEQFLEHWLEKMEKSSLKISTYVRYRSILDIHLLPALGHLTLRHLSTAHLDTLYAQKLEEGYAPRTVHIIHGVLHQALVAAVKRRYISRNVCDDVTLPRVTKTEIQPLSKEQAQKLMEAAKGHRLETLITLAITTGMRRGELLALKWEDINWQGSSISVRRTVNRYGEGYGYVVSEPKSGKSRNVVIPAFVLDSLKQHQAQQAQQRTAAGDKWSEQHLVFAGPTGSFLHPNHLREAFDKLLQNASLPHIRFHDLRHSAATILLSMDVHPKIVQEILGHSDISMTLGIYSHVMPSLHRETMQKVDEAYRSGEGKQSKPHEEQGKPEKGGAE